MNNAIHTLNKNKMNDEGTKKSKKNILYVLSFRYNIIYMIVFDSMCVCVCEREIERDNKRRESNYS